MANESESPWLKDLLGKSVFVDGTEVQPQRSYLELVAGGGIVLTPSDANGRTVVTIAGDKLGKDVFVDGAEATPKRNAIELVAGAGITLSAEDVGGRTVVTISLT